MQVQMSNYEWREVPEVCHSNEAQAISIAETYTKSNKKLSTRCYRSNATEEKLIDWTIKITIRIFIGRIAEGTTNDDILQLLRKLGAVAECDVISNFCFVHVEFL